MEKKGAMDGVRWRNMSGSSGCVYQTGVGPCLTERNVGAVSGDSSHVPGEQEKSGWTSRWNVSIIPMSFFCPSSSSETSADVRETDQLFVL